MENDNTNIPIMTLLNDICSIIEKRNKRMAKQIGLSQRDKFRNEFRDYLKENGHDDRD